MYLIIIPEVKNNFPNYDNSIYSDTLHISTKTDHHLIPS